MTNKRNKPMKDLPEALQTQMEMAASPPKIEVVETATPAPPPAVLVSMTVSLPFWSGFGGYTKRRHDVILTQKQAGKLKGIYLGLEEMDAQLENGKYVSNPVDAIRWLLENANANEKTT
jgi:hypothetical protein